jgi:hypothetical protein
MRTRVASVVGLLSLGCAAAAWTGAPSGMAEELIRGSLGAAAALALTALNAADARLVHKDELARAGGARLEAAA